MTELDLGKLGGSDMAAILGVSKYRTPLDVWRRVVLGDRDPMTGRAAHWGILLEEPIAQSWAAEQGLTLTKPPSRHRADRPWQRWSVDREIVERPREIVEVKTAGINVADNWGPAELGPIPEDYRVQVETYLEAGDYDLAHVLVLIAGQDDRHYAIERDRELGAMIVEAGKRFWRDHVVTRIPPALDGSLSSRRYLDSLHPTDRGPIRDAAAEEEALARRWQELHELERSVEEARYAIENELRQRIGDARGVQGGFGKVLWTPVAAGEGPDWETIAKELAPSPTVLARLARERVKKTRGAYRRLDVKVKKESA